MNAKSQTCLGQTPRDSEAFETAIQAGASDTTAHGEMESAEQTTRLVETSSRLAGGDRGSENPAGRFHARVCVPDGPRVIADGSSVKANARCVIADGSSVKANARRVIADGSSVKANARRVIADGSSVKANARRVIADGSSVKANARCVIAHGSSVKANARRVIADGSSVKADARRVIADGSSVKADARRVIADGRNLRTTTSPVKPVFPPLRAPKAGWQERFSPEPPACAGRRAA